VVVSRDEPVWFWALALLAVCPAGAVVAAWVIGGGLIAPLIGGTFGGFCGAAVYLHSRKRREQAAPPIL
jgi:hypothetical protein